MQKQQKTKSKDSLDDSYLIDTEDDLFKDVHKKKQYFTDESTDDVEEIEAEEIEDYDKDEIDLDLDSDYDSFDEEKANNFQEYTYEQTSDSDRNTFTLIWRTIDEFRALFFKAKFGGDKKDYLFYDKIDEPDEHIAVKKAGAIVVKKWSETALIRYAPELILLIAIVFSTIVLYVGVASKKENEKTDNEKEMERGAKYANRKSRGGEKQPKRKKDFEPTKTS